MTSPLLSVVVPTRNEAEGIGEFWRALETEISQLDYEVWFVDDSDDATTSFLQKLANGNAAVHCLVRRGEEREGGLSTAVSSGMRACTGEYVCVMDADLQHPPQLIGSMLQKATAGADLVVASRYTSGGGAGGLGSRTRHLVSRAATALSRLLFVEARTTSDPLSGYFLCRRALLDGIELRPVGFKILLELLVCVPKIQVAEVPLRFQTRVAGESKAQAAQGLQFLRHLFSIFWNVKGSARRWKFALVGASGLVLLVGGAELLQSAFGISGQLSFPLPLAASVAWNTWLNHNWTFADMRRLPGEEREHYLRHALLSAAIIGTITSLLLWRQVPLAAALLCGALLGIILNGAGNWRMVHAPAANWNTLLDKDLLRRLTSLAGEIHAGRAYIVGTEADATWPWGDLLARVVAQRRGLCLTQTISHRVQRRTHLGNDSIIMAPVIHEGEVVAVIVCESDHNQSFAAGALEVVTSAAEALSPGIHLAARPRTLPVTGPGTA